MKTNSRRYFIRNIVASTAAFVIGSDVIAVDNDNIVSALPRN